MTAKSRSRAISRESNGDASGKSMKPSPSKDRMAASRLALVDKVLTSDNLV
jgi:hypothetical protein